MTFIVPRLEDLPAATEKLLPYIKNNLIVAIYGSMGAGKTTLIKELCRQLGVADIVNSPTFALVNEYKTTDQRVIYHFDFYRINSLREVFDIGYEDFFFSGNLCLIEWPEKIESLLPLNVLRIKISEIHGGIRELEVDVTRND
jgi:tRNA threonylcarbamoyladenosine biosynthesis protein TsaE